MQLRADQLAYKNDRETLKDLYDKLAERETRVAAIAAMNGGQRWPGAPDGLAGILIYLADMLSNAYQVAGWTLRENCHERFEQLRPGELKFSLEVIYQLMRSRKMLEDLNDHLIEDYRARHPRLAAEEMDAYEAARKAAARDLQASQTQPAQTQPALSLRPEPQPPAGLSLQPAASSEPASVPLSADRTGPCCKQTYRTARR